MGMKVANTQMLTHTLSETNRRRVMDAEKKRQRDKKATRSIGVGHFILLVNHMIDIAVNKRGRNKHTRMKFYPNGRSTIEISLILLLSLWYIN